MIDLRSDTVTKPTVAMRRAIADAEVGDDVYHDDPTVIALEEKTAALLGKEDAVYVPSGTLANQIALRTHTEPGDVVLAAQKAHIATFEMGAPAALSGVTVSSLPTVAGTFAADDVRAAVPKLHASMPSSVIQPVRLLAAENTHNGYGGRFWPPEQLKAVAVAAREEGLATHLDGARLWNAAIASGTEPGDLAADFDSVSVCFSKGLGAPVGSAVAGSAELVTRARRFKQMFGGGFRQAGLLAAGAIHGLEHHRQRIVEDHDNAARLAAGLAEIPGIEVDVATVETNMVYFDVTAMAAPEFCDELFDLGAAVLHAGGSSIRAVTHLDVSTDDIDATLTAAREVLG